MAPAAARKSPVRSLPSDKPPKVALNLDTLERENGPVEPYVVILDGKRLVFSDPQELPWQDLVDLNEPDEFAQLCLEDEEMRAVFLDTRIPAWKLQAAMQGFRQHYGLGRSGESGA